MVIREEQGDLVDVVANMPGAGKANMGGVVGIDEGGRLVIVEAGRLSVN